MKIALLGYGKMGRLVETVALREGWEIGPKLDVADNKGGSGITPGSMKGVDVAIDFSQPDAVLSNLEACSRARVNIVVGTTGPAAVGNPEHRRSERGKRRHLSNRGDLHSRCRGVSNFLRGRCFDSAGDCARRSWSHIRCVQRGARAHGEIRFCLPRCVLGRGARPESEAVSAHEGELRRNESDPCESRVGHDGQDLGKLSPASGQDFGPGSGETGCRSGAARTPAAMKAQDPLRLCDKNVKLLWL